MVECELLSLIGKMYIDAVLIDTWWNVNQTTGISADPTAIVLIDTWWNVNHIKMIFYTILICFNRYMVECEYLNPSVVW